MTPFSVLDLSPIVQGGTATQALANSRDLAQHAERLGYKRVWLAEHHNMPGIASSATAVAIAHVADGTKTIRVGAGGIMLPNHAPLVIAEQFGTLAAIHPNRIDLALGRAPGTDQTTVRALRRDPMGGEDFPQDVGELIGYFAPARPGQAVRAVPGEGQQVPIWILGSSLYGAQFAAINGFPYAFASHFAPGAMTQAIQLYRERFQPSEWQAKPYVMLGCNICAAETDEEARRLFSSRLQSTLNLRLGRPGPLPPPVDDLEAIYGPIAPEALRELTGVSFVGSAQTIEREIAAFLEKTRADELIIACQIYDHRARIRSYEIAAAVRERLAERERQPAAA